MLQRGAARVYAVDVGTGQLDARLRRDPRVVVMEKTNARSLDPRIFSEQPTLAVVDVSFISLEKVMPAVLGVVAPRADVIALIKQVGRTVEERTGITLELELKIVGQP